MDQEHSATNEEVAMEDAAVDQETHPTDVDPELSETENKGGGNDNEVGCVEQETATDKAASADDNDASSQEGEDNMEVDEKDKASIKTSGRKDQDDDDGDDNDAEDNDYGSINEVEEDDNDSGSDRSSSEEDSDSDDNEDDDDDGNGLSEYEKLRLERIKRNQAKLAQLGLQGKEDGGVLGKNKPAKKRPKRPSVEPTKRDSLSRSSKKRIDYNATIDLRLLKPRALNPEGKKQSKRVEKPRKKRLPLFVYSEFKRIKSKRKQNVRQAKRYLRAAEKEVKYWRKQADKFAAERQKQLVRERIEKQQDEERKMLGCTKMELLAELDRRTPELLNVTYQYDAQQAAKNQMEQYRLRMEQAEKHKQQMHRKMQMIDSLDRFPKTLKDAMGSLNAMLYYRSPKDPPPPRRSKRKSDGDEPNTPSRKGTKGSDSATPGSSEKQEPTGSSWTNLASALEGSPSTVEAAAAIAPTSDSHPPDSAAASGPNNKQAPKKKKEPRNVGGWISPPFAAEIDRSWLEREKPTSHFDLPTYVPQVGDTVLYYPAAHKTFLDVFPDILGMKSRNVLRVPLWQRAKREMAKQKKSKDDSSSKIWWTDEWVQGITSELGNYPMVCRVERTHTEFPADPYQSDKVVTENGTIAWVVPEQKQKKRKRKKKDKPQMRLAVALRPLTPVQPPEWTDSGLQSNDSISLPPNFSVVTFPSPILDPFLIPFSWAYNLTHSLSFGDAVTMRDQDASKGKVSAFNTVGEQFGSFRLDDKILIVQNILSKLNDGHLSMQEAIEEALSRDDVPNSSRSNSSKFPASDACFVVEFLNKYMAQFASSTKKEESTPTFQGNLLDLIRSTLPLNNGISIIRTVFNRQPLSLPRWKLTANKRADKANPLMLPGIENGLHHHIENALRVKIVCTLQDFVENKEGAEIFEPRVSEEVAPSYYNAVPVGMHFARILSRLDCIKDSRCYYTSLESVLSDIQAISDNCNLYNSPESALVATCNDLIPDIKHLISDVFTQHARERSSRTKAVEERRRFVMRNCDASALQEGTSDKKNTGKQKKGPAIPDGLNTPFKGPICRAWLQTLNKDGSWQPKSNSNEAPKLVSSGWIPQSGDTILYSRSLHSDFIKGHFHSLSKEQCMLPRFQASETATNVKSVDCTDTEKISTSDSADGGSLKPAADDKATEESPKPDPVTTSRDIISEEVQKNWLVGTVVGVRSSFPRVPNVKEGEESFKTAAPIVVIGLRFQYSWSRGEAHAISWRPCSSSEGNNEECRSCGLSELSFLQPAWIHKEENDTLPILTPDIGSPLQAIVPCGLDEDVLSSIGRCFDMLKRRCLGGVSPDYVNPSFCMEHALRGHAPGAARMGARSLPSFEDFLLPPPDDSKKTMNTRGIRKNYDDEVIEKLSNIHFLPPWSLQVLEAPEGPQTHETFHHEAMMPFPTLCLELIRLRIINGFYRRSSGIVNDLTEAYVTSVFFILSGPAFRKKNRISIRKIAKYLQSAKNSQVATFVLPKETKKKIKKKSPISKNLMSSPKSGKEANKKKEKKKAKVASNEMTPTEPEGQTNKKKPKKKATVASNRVASAEPEKGTKKKKTKKTTAATRDENLFETSAEVKSEPDIGSLEGLSEEEAALVARIDKIRRLYATAIVCATESRDAERIFGIARKEKKEPEQQPVLIATTQRESVHLAAVKRVRYILTAIARDPCRNRFNFYGLKKFKVSCDGQVVDGEKSALPVTPNLGTSHPVIESAPNRAFLLQSPPDDCMKFNWHDFEMNDDLARCMFGRPGRKAPCVRCQVYNVSFLNCRVRRGHSNPDFGFIENFKNFGGVDGLLRPLFAPNLTQTPLTAQAHNETPDHQPGEVGQVESQVKRVEEGEEASSKANGSDEVAGRQENTKDKPTDSIEFFEKAQSALKLASYLFSQANLISDAPLRLGESFIKNSFPVDPTDGHFSYCIICGLPGDVLCCDGCSNVVHAHCVGLEKLPDGDWFCEKCCSKTGLTANDIHTTPNTAGVDTHKAQVPTQARSSENSTKTQLSEVDVTFSDVPIEAQNTSDPAQCQNSENSDTTQPTYEAVEGQKIEKEILEKGDKIHHSPSDDIALFGTAPGFRDITTSPCGENQTSTVYDDSGKTAQQPVNSEPKETPRPDISDEIFDERTSELDTILSDLKSCRLSPPALPSDQPLKQIATEENPLTENGEGGDNQDEDQQIPMGLVFTKTFEGLGDFKGKVVHLPTSQQPYFQVEYEDGDGEDLSISELLDLLPPNEREKYSNSYLKQGDPAKRQDMSTNRKRQKNEPEPYAIVQEHPPKRGRGRPRKILTSDAISTEDYGTPSAYAINQEHPPKRGRGRPRKIQTSDAISTEDYRTPSATATPQRGRGRPRKKSIVDVQKQSSIKKKVLVQEISDTEAKGKGQTRKTHIDVLGDENTSKIKAANENPIHESPKRGRGRPRKRPTASVEEQTAENVRSGSMSKNKSQNKRSPSPGPEQKRQKTARESPVAEVLRIPSQQVESRRGRRSNTRRHNGEGDEIESEAGMNVLAEVQKLAEEESPRGRRRSSSRCSKR